MASVNVGKLVEHMGTKKPPVVEPSKPVQQDSWMVDAKQSVLQSKEWKMLASEVVEGIRGNLKRNNIQFFSELKEGEKGIFINEIEDELRSSDAFMQFQKALGDMLEEKLHSAVNQQLKTAEETASKTDIILDFCARGSTEVLQKWPDLSSRLKFAFNSELPVVLRRETWKLLLSNRPARELYLATRDEKFRASNVSDSDITHKVTAIVESNFPEFQGAYNVPTAMKEILLYTTLTNGFLSSDAYFHFIPIVAVFLKDAQPGRYGSLAEYFMSIRGMELPRIESRFSDLRPEVAHLSEEFKGHFERILNEEDVELVDYLLQIGQKEDSEEEFTLALLLAQSMVHRLFVGMFRLEVSLYIRDTCLLSSFRVMAPYFAVAALLLLKDAIMQRETKQGIQRVLESESRRLMVAQFQALMEARFMPRLRVELDIPDPRNHQFTSYFDYEHMEEYKRPTREDVTGRLIDELRKGDGSSIASGVDIADITSLIEAPKTLEEEIMDENKREQIRKNLARWRRVSHQVVSWSIFFRLLRNAVRVGSQRVVVSRLGCMVGGHDQFCLARGALRIAPIKFLYRVYPVELQILPIYLDWDHLSDTANRALSASINKPNIPPLDDKKPTILTLLLDSLIPKLPYVMDDRSIPTRCISFVRNQTSYSLYMHSLIKGQNAEEVVLSALRREGLPAFSVEKFKQELETFTTNSGGYRDPGGEEHFDESVGGVDETKHFATADFLSEAISLAMGGVKELAVGGSRELSGFVERRDAVMDIMAKEKADAEMEIFNRNFTDTEVAEMSAKEKAAYSNKLNKKLEIAHLKRVKAEEKEIAIKRRSFLKEAK